jgi:2-polyprenyl-3-methyl-5-hydroxy-6-metoxy-1,4-benzoquinol methylase
MDYEKGGQQKEHYNPDEVIKRNCPLCEEDNYSHIYKERGAVGIVKCRNCGLIYTNPMAREAEKNYWGNEEKYYEEARLIFKGLAKHHRDLNYLEDLKRIETIKPEGNFLDIGTNMGFFLRHALGKKWNVFGLEPSSVLSKMARAYFGLNVKNSSQDNAGFKEAFFDIITMTDVFEHINEPKKILGDIKKVLKPDGILFIKVPNGNYSMFKLWLSRLAGVSRNFDIFDSYEHLAHYNQKTLEKMLENCGFSVKKVLIGRPIQIPVWHNYVGHYYQYPSPWILDAKNYILRLLFYWCSKVEFLLRGKNIGYLAPNIIVIAEPKKTV